MKKEKRQQKHRSQRRHRNLADVKLRLSVHRSTQHIYAQIIDDKLGQTVVAESDLKLLSGTKSEKAKQVGENLAKKALAKKINQIVFDRGGFHYHGRVASLAEGARKGGLKF